MAFILNYWSGYNLRESYKHLENEAPEVIQHEIDFLVERDGSGFKKRIFFVAASGFFTDAYFLFATNVISPMLAYIYWQKETSDIHSLVINEVTLAGSFIGMLVFGHLSDLWGRKSLYGVELVIVIIATLGLTQASAGYNNKSMMIYPWIIFWRFLLGVGIGAEYPLSALIASEWSSTPSRGRMLALVFLMQPLGQLAAYLIGFGALLGFGKHIDHNGNHEQWAPELDKVWRLVLGVGGVPALFAIIMRWRIPETPSYLMKIAERPRDALYAADSIFSHGRRSVTPLQEVVISNQPIATADPSETPSAREAAPAISRRGNRVDRSSATSVPQPQKQASEEGDLRYPQFTWKKWMEFLGNKEKGYGYILAGAAICWFILDVAYYGLGLDNPRTLAKFWASTKPTNVTELPDYEASFTNQTIFDDLKEDLVHALYTIPIPSIFSSLCLVFSINYFPRAALLKWTFVLLAFIFLIMGTSLLGVFEKPTYIVTIVFYAFALCAFNFGPNALTFMLPAELFPTKYRGTCYGIAAASGKFGAIIIQLIVHYTGVTNPNDKKALSTMLIVFCPLMLVGATYACWIPEVQWPPGYERVDESHEPKNSDQSQDQPSEKQQEPQGHLGFGARRRFVNKKLVEIEKDPIGDSTLRLSNFLKFWRWSFKLSQHRQ